MSPCCLEWEFKWLNFHHMGLPLNQEPAVWIETSSYGLPFEMRIQARTLQGLCDPTPARRYVLNFGIRRPPRQALSLSAAESENIRIRDSRSKRQRDTQSLTGAATQSNRQAAAVGSAAAQASTGLQTVASATEALTASIGEIARQVVQSPAGPDQRYRRANQPACAQRHHRGGPRRGGRKGFRRGGVGRERQGCLEPVLAPSPQMVG